MVALFFVLVSVGQLLMGTARGLPNGSGGVQSAPDVRIRGSMRMSEVQATKAEGSFFVPFATLPLLTKQDWIGK